MAPTATTRSRADTAAGPPREGGGSARAHTPERAQTYQEQLLAGVDRQPEEPRRAAKDVASGGKNGVPDKGDARDTPPEGSARARTSAQPHARTQTSPHGEQHPAEPEPPQRASAALVSTLRLKDVQGNEVDLLEACRELLQPLTEQLAQGLTES